MTETDIECRLTKKVLYPRGINNGCITITFTRLTASEFNDNFKDNFMQE